MIICTNKNPSGFLTCDRLCVHVCERWNGGGGVLSKSVYQRHLSVATYQVVMRRVESQRHLSQKPQVL